MKRDSGERLFLSFAKQKKILELESIRKKIGGVFKKFKQQNNQVMEL